MRSRFERLQVPSAVAVGGALGSLMRWGVAGAIPSVGFPWATLMTNLTGCFALGVVLVFGEVVGSRRHRHHARPWARLWRPFMATGVLGGFTTFSTFVLEAVRRDALTSGIYVVMSLGFGLAAYWSGNVGARKAFGVRA